MDAREVAASGRAKAGMRRLPHPLLWLVSPLAYPLLHAAAPVLPDVLSALFAFLLVVLMPGWLLRRLILARSTIELPGRIVRAFILGIAIVSLLGLIVWFSGGDTHLGPVPGRHAPPPPFAGRLSAIVWGEAAFLALGALGLLASHLLRRPAPPTPAPAPAAPAAPADEGETVWQRIVREAYRLGEPQKRVPASVPRGVMLLVLGAILALGAGLAFHAGGNFGFDSDSAAHIAAVREMVQRDRVLPRTAFYADGDGASVDPRFGFFHVALAATAQLARLDPARLWDLLPGILIPFALLVVYALARRALRGQSPALLATLLALLCYGDAGRGLLARVAYGNFMGIVLIWGVLALSMHFALGATRPAVLALIALAAFAATATHVFSAVAVLFGLGVFLAAVLLVRGPAHVGVRRAALALAAAAAGLLLPLAWRLRYAAAALSPIHTERQGVLFLGPSLFVIQPQLWWAYLGGIGLVASGLALWIWRRVRLGDSEIFLASLSLAPFLILLNPIVTPWLEPKLGYLLARLAVLVPFLLVLAYLTRVAAQSLLDLDSRRHVVRAVVFLALLAWLFVPRAQILARSYSAGALKAQRARSLLAWEGLLRRLDAEIDTPAVVLSDPLTGYSIPAMTRHYTVAVLSQHGSPADSLALARLAACRDVLSPYLGTGEKARLCRRFGVDYVLVNATFTRPIDLFFAHVGPTLAWRQRGALEEDVSLFERVADYGARGALFRVRRENLDALSGIVTAGQPQLPVRSTERLTRGMVLRALPADARPVLPDTAAGITLAAIAFDRARVARGDSVGVTLYWRRVGTAPAIPTVTQLAIQTPSPRGPLAAWPGLSRLDRLWAQRRRHVLYRWRTPAPLLEGTFAIEHWPRDRYVVDRVRLAVVPPCVPGRYAVTVSWAEAAYLPNARLSEYLSDAEAHAGTAAGTLEVY